MSDEIRKQRSSNVIEDEKLMEPHPLTELDRISKNVELLESNVKNSEEDDANQTIFDPNTQVITFTIKEKMS